MNDSSNKGTKTNWLAWFMLLLWLGRYSQDVGAVPVGKSLISPTLADVMYWVATIGAAILGLYLLFNGACRLIEIAKGWLRKSA